MSTHCSNTKSAFLLDSTLYSTFVGSWLVLLLSRSQNQVWTFKTPFSANSKFKIDHKCMVDINNRVLSDWEVPINMRAAFLPPHPHLGGAMKGGGSKEFNETISFWHNVTCFKKSFLSKKPWAWPLQRLKGMGFISSARDFLIIFQ